MFVSRFSDIRRKTLVHLCIVSLIQTPKLIVTSWSILPCYNSLWYTVMWQFCCFVSWSLPTFLLEFLLSALLSESPLILCFFMFITIFTYSLIFTQESFKLFVELNNRRHIQESDCFREVVSCKWKWIKKKCELFRNVKEYSVC